MKYRVCFVSFCWLLALPLFAAESPTPTSTPLPLILIKAAHLLDPVAGAVRENQAILIEGDKVKQVGAAADVVLSPAAAGSKNLKFLGEHVTRHMSHVTLLRSQQRPINVAYLRAAAEQHRFIEFAP